MAAFFASKEHDRSINVMKLIKLMYLSDRESMERHGDPITYDFMFSLDEGPILSRSLNMINGQMSGEWTAAWREWMTPRDANHAVAATDVPTRHQLDHLSDADMDVLRAVWEQFGHMNQWQLSDYTHQHCPEWQDPHGSRLVIEPDVLLTLLGRSREEAAEIAQDIASERKLDQLLARR